MLLVGTGNLHKLEEIAAILQDFSMEAVSLDYLPPVEEVEETGSTFRENAKLKADYFSRVAASLDPQKRPSWVIADDSGLFWI